MHVKVGQARLDGAQKFDVVIAVEIFRQAALDAHLGGAEFNRFDGFGHQRIGGVKISVR